MQLSTTVCRLVTVPDCGSNWLACIKKAIQALD